MIRKGFHKLWLILSYLFLRFIKEGFTYRAASLAYATLLAIVPLTIVTFTILSFFPAFSGIAAKLQQFIIHNFVAESANVISTHIDHFLSNVHKLSKVNIVFLVILNLLMLYNINQAFNSVWRAKPKINLSITFLIYFIVLLLSPIVFGGVLVLASFVFKLSYVQNLMKHVTLLRPIIVLLPHLVTFLTFTVFNWILPSCRVRLLHAVVGGFITTVIFELAKTGFAFYLSKFSTYRVVYGALATLPLFLIWLYVSWLIILLGAIVTNLVAVGVPEPWQQKLKKV